VVKKCESR